MKKIFRVLSVFIISWFLVVTSIGVSATSNIIKDGDFEAGGTAWNLRNKGVISTTHSYPGGTNSGMVPNTAISGNFANGFIGQAIDLKPNTDYRVNAYTMVDIEGADAIFTGRWFNNNSQGDVIKVGEQTVDQAVTSTDWKEVEYTFNSGTNTKAMIQLVKWSDKEESKAANAYIDNVTVTELETELPEEKVYHELWRDEFAQDSLNMDDWGYELGNIRGTEHQHYVNDEENVFLRDGKLVLRATDRAKEDQYTHPRDSRRTVIYDSGSVRTHGKREFLYGKLEISAKLPKGKAVFPAFWTLGADFTLDGKINNDQGRGWPATGEIDIMELIGSDVDGSAGNRSVYQTIHYGPTENNVGKFSGNGTNYAMPKGNFNDDFHTFAFEWDENTMNWFVDDKIVRSVPYSQDKMAKDIFNKPQYIQMNLAMGGAWPGFVGENLAGTEYIIDYVSYSQTDEQKAASDRYYETAPTIENVGVLEMNRGTTFNPLLEVTHSEGTTLDFSIEDSPMFQHVGGNINVQQLVSGIDDLEKMATLPVGTYNLHYSATPTGIDLTSNLDAGVARRSTELIVKPNVFPLDFKLEGKAGEPLSSVKLPEGWNWVDANLTIDADIEYEVYFMDPSTGERQLVQINIIKVMNYESIDQALSEALEALNNDKYTKESLEALQLAYTSAKETRTRTTDQSSLDDATKTLRTALNNLEVKETPKVETETPKVDTDTGTKLPATGISTTVLPSIIALTMIATGIVLLRKKRQED